jgi:4-hydroxy-tetrahydrodipicolinate reductase
MYKVIQWFTGQLGQRQLREVLAHPGLELVGVVTQNPAKVGMDAGDMLGGGCTGITVIADIDAALAIDADVVLLSGIEWKPDLIARILASGKNVLTTWGGWYMKYEPEFEMLEAAARQGGSSLVGTGNMPGLVNEAMPLFLSGFQCNVSRIWTRERNQPISNTSYDQLVGFEGISKPPPADPFDHPLVPICTWSFRQPAHLLADAFGVRLDDFRCTNADWGLATNDFYLDGIKTWVRKGTVAGFRFEFTGFVEAKPWLVHEFELVHSYDIGRGYRESPDDPEFTVEVTGTPSLRLELKTLDGVDSSDNVLEINAQRVVNMIPHIVAAEPGCRSILDMRLIAAGHGAGPCAVDSIDGVTGGRHG